MGWEIACAQPPPPSPRSLRRLRGVVRDEEFRGTALIVTKDHVDHVNGGFKGEPNICIFQRIKHDSDDKPPRVSGLLQDMLHKFNEEPSLRDLFLNIASNAFCVVARRKGVLINDLDSTYLQVPAQLAAHRAFQNHLKLQGGAPQGRLQYGNLDSLLVDSTGKHQDTLHVLVADAGLTSA